MVADRIHDPLLRCQKGIPVRVEITLVFVDMAIPSDVDVHSDKNGMAVNTDTIGLELLDFNPLVTFVKDDNFLTVLGRI